MKTKGAGSNANFEPAIAIKKPKRTKLKKEKEKSLKKRRKQIRQKTGMEILVFSLRYSVFENAIQLSKGINPAPNDRIFSCCRAFQR